jgi:hypothetical protein
MLSLLSILLLFVAAASAQPVIQPVAANSWPVAIPYKGQPLSLNRWQQPDGTHYLSVCTTKLIEDADGARSQYLYAQHAILTADSITVVWKMQDYVQDCPVDVVCEWVQLSKDSKTPFFTQLTDLDKDGEPEIWLLYRIACQGDVSPADQKLLMYEGRQKHALRGTVKLRVSATLQMGGEYKADAAMQAAPAVLQARAAQLWQQFGSLTVK